ncbi:hypothetical protein E3H11_43665, partial [Bradyrhizobium brasilense]|nr:hypothetical protein [Bradyrhizobium brasilense]
AGQVDLIETPAPDAVPQLKAAGMRIVDNVTPHVWNYHLSVLPEIKQRGFNLYSNEEPHVWPWQFSRVEGSPWNDIRVRKAAN